MKFRKLHLDDIVRCYSTSKITIADKLYAFFASENPESECFSYTGDNFEVKEKVWDDRGGCMSIIPFEDREGEFLAINEFYLKVSPSKSKIVHGKKTADGWEIKDVFSLPFLHRFDIYHVNDKNFFIGATIASDKVNKEDWSKPGQIYVGEIPNDLSQGINLKVILDGCYRNHGYSRGIYDGKVCGYFASDQGVFRVIPPISGEEDWQVDKILEGNISEIALIDINNDGIEEIMTIEPFHGNQMKIYKLVNDVYKVDYVYPTEIEFAHALVGDTLNGVNSFIGGVRRKNCELFVIQYLNDKYQVSIVDNGGPANIAVVHHHNQDMILSANHTNNEAAIYYVENE